MQRAYDRIEVATPTGGTKPLTPEEFEALPLSERVKLLMGRSLRFFRGEEEISPRKALRDG
jgi:hypothetical protein